MDSLVYLEHPDGYDMVVEAADITEALQILKDKDEDEYGQLTEEAYIRTDVVPGFEEFLEKYKPFSVGEDEYLLEDCPTEFPADKVWTLVEGDTDGAMWLIPGFHRVNRQGWITCEVAWTEANLAETYFY